MNTEFIESIRFGCRTSVDIVCPAPSYYVRPIASIGDGAFFVGTPAVNPILDFQPIAQESRHDVV